MNFTVLPGMGDDVFEGPKTYFTFVVSIFLTPDDLFIYSLKIHKQKWRWSKVYCETSRQPFDQSAQLSFLEIKPYG